MTEKARLTEDPVVLKALLATTERAYLQGHDFATKTQEHTDKMLTWAIGLMGGGLYGAYALLRCGPSTCGCGHFCPGCWESSAL